MNFRPLLVLGVCLSGSMVCPEEQPDFPILAEDLDVRLFAKEPLVRNPCAIAFDAKGRLCVGMGPQYRRPKPNTPGDSVWILLDENQDGVAEGRKEFAKGLNCIQGLAWRRDELWIANAPDLTVVRDLDGDDVAEEYVRVFTDLGNLEHGLHGLNWGPDGKLYMSKGNSKGLTQLPDRVAPKAFRDLWGVEAPDAPDMPKPVKFTADNYKKNYHDPSDDWGQQGGILRYDPETKKLEIFAQGFRNPWDICFDDQFTWLGTDNDQTHGDKIFSPFQGAHFGWGHEWSYDWKGDQHLPTAPSSGPLFEGSGAGVVHLNLPTWPEQYRDVFLINDWLKREIYIYQPTWDGAWRKPLKEKFDLLAHAEGGRSMGSSRGRAFDPVDIAVGPDGAVWVSSWGRQYGALMRDGQQANEGRIYRIFPKGQKASWKPEDKRNIPLSRWSTQELIDDLKKPIPVWRTNASEELVRREDRVLGTLQFMLGNHKELDPHFETWASWTMGRIAPHFLRMSAYHIAATRDSKSLNKRIQNIRIAVHRHKESSAQRLLHVLWKHLDDPEPRIRLETVLAMRELAQKDQLEGILNLLSKEKDRVVFYAAWKALEKLTSVSERKEFLSDTRVCVRLGVFLSLLEEDALKESEIRPLVKDKNPGISALANKRLGGKAKVEHRGRPIRKTKPSKTEFRNLPVAFVKDLKPTSRKRYEVATLEEGIPVYTDRSYTITSVPDQLLGSTFIRTANSDAERHDDQPALEFTLNTPATIYLADDARAEHRPPWARKHWKPTDLTIKTTDPKEMRVYKKHFPIGKVSLGANKQDVRSRKGNYLIIIQPELITFSGTTPQTKTEQVLPLLNKGNALRGRDLFHSKQGVGCSACHRMEGNGNVFAPDLTGITKRATPDFIVEAILNPSAAITEGFVLQQFYLKKGKQPIAGIVIEETGQFIKVAQTGGKVHHLQRSEIVKRESLPHSAMPPYFTILQPLHIADLVAYLRETQPKTQPTPPSTKGFSYQQDDTKLSIWLDGVKITDYLMDHPQLTRRAFIHVTSHTGIQVSRNFPPKPSDSDDHLLMHPGIWMGFGHLDGQDYWRLKAKVVHDKFIKPPNATKDKFTFQSLNRYLTSDGKEETCQEVCSITFQRHQHGILLLWDSSFTNPHRDFYFGDQEESGLAIRMHTPLSVQHGNGTILNDQGQKNGKGTWGKTMKWIDYSGQFKGRHVGLMVIPSPDNPRQCWSHSRDYGVLVANPFPKQPKERREPYIKTWVKKGETFRMRYAVLIHDSDKPIQHQDVYDEISNTFLKE